jgi:hypothetical protein
MMHGNGQRSVTVDRLKLIEKLKSNLEIHIKDYEEAKIGYKIKLKQDLEDALEFFDERPYEQLPKLIVQNNPPRSYEKEYLDAITLLEWQVGDTVELDQTTFKQFVQNEWAWSGGFEAMNTTYKSFAASAARR